MSGFDGTTWTVIAYVAGLGLLWGYAGSVWVARRRFGARGCEKNDGGQE